MKPLTKRQTEVFELVKSHIQETGMPPTRAEIAKHLGFRSANAAEEHLRALARKGVIEMVPGTSRGIRLVESANTEVQDDAANDPSIEGLPLIGQVAAGAPILASQHVESRYAVDPNLFHPAANFLLRVQGESMKDIGIMDGDLLAVHKTQDVQNGQVVVARLDDDVTVKRFEREGKRVFLHAENESFNSIEVDLEFQQLEIEGLAVGVIRNADWM
ncbi:transcriptional repressor LexA [Alginatibacterium sediminis]|uniref:LexA repressor n=1 Tax=Alginatibacterium sediminis TaxID=2164068 RepID=A0A420E698_9ALTE|nr:transcriptional repressor LexA [Alginatibacterium sediminis]RKF13141.1 transcriptional repressor LexA [Alginatibacterium sediminis]